jgi:hypothetical protein
LQHNGGMADLSDAQWDYVLLFVEWQRQAEWMDVRDARLRATIGARSRWGAGQVLNLNPIAEPV